MSELARRSPASPGAPGWGDVRRQMTVAAQAVTASLAAWLAAGGDDAAPAAAMSVLAVGVLQDLAGLARRLDFGDAVVDEACDRAVERDRASRPGRRLRAVN